MKNYLNTNDIENYNYKIFNFVLSISTILYIISLISIFSFDEKYLDYLDLVIKVYISLFLIIKFYPSKNIKFTRIDKKITFSAGIFLISTTIIDQIIRYYINDIKNIIENINYKFNY
jgi:hypothetical protein